jgi:multidrug efflux system outer membrane protein
MRRSAAAIFCVSVLLLTACKVGPNYARPSVPTAPAYRGPGNDPVSTPESVADEKWWELFKDPVLQELVRTALKQNYNLQIAASRVLQVAQQVTITRANQFPTVGVGPAFTGTRQPGIPGIFSGYTYLADALTISASWNIDFWGQYRRATEAARANLRATEWGRRAIVSSLVENVATAYMQLREYDLELEIAKRTLETRKQSLVLTQTLEQGGATSMVDVRQAEQLVEQAAEAIPQTEQAIQQQENAISLLLGQNPGPIPRGMAITDQPNPDEVPAGLPSQLLERRPDIQQAEQSLIAANAQIGVARAQLFPSIPLTASGGVESIGLGNLFAWSARAWNFSASASQPIFNAGALRANVRLTEAQKQQAILTYQQSIQTAFREVSDSLIAYRKLREYRTHQAALTQAAQESSSLAQIRYKGGATSYLEVLTNDTNFFTAQLALARADLGERLSLVQLYNALGGGWQQQ